MIKDVINNFIENWANKQEIYLKLGTVTSVSEADFSFIMKPNTGDGAIEVDMTTQGSNNSAFVVVPAVGSVVLVGYTNNSDAYAVSIETADKIIFNGGQNDGLINIADQTTKLNKLVTEVKALKNAYNTHTHTVSGAVTLVPLVPFTGNFTKFNKSDYEDEKIMH